MCINESEETTTYRRCVGKSSAPRQSRALKPIVETAPKTQLRMRLSVVLFTKYMPKADPPDNTMLSTENMESI